jgi:hypothetical protein
MQGRVNFGELGSALHSAQKSAQMVEEKLTLD